MKDWRSLLSIFHVRAELGGSQNPFLGASSRLPRNLHFHIYSVQEVSCEPDALPTCSTAERQNEHAVPLLAPLALDRDSQQAEGKSGTRCSILT